jgi:uncharacterized membrane protein YcaP (DUF421 family)
MGKKQISQLSFFDYVVGITIGSIAATLSVDDTITYSRGITALVIWAISPIAISYINLKSMRARRIFEGIPTILIQNGRIIKSNLKKEKIHLNDLLEELRIKGVFNIEDVEFAILETSGKMSVQLRSQEQPVTPSDLNIPTHYKGLTANLIIDGKIMHDNLNLVGLDENWLTNELHKKDIQSADQVFLASLNTTGSLYIQLKKDKEAKQLSVLE